MVGTEPGPPLWAYVVVVPFPFTDQKASQRRVIGLDR